MPGTLLAAKTSSDACELPGAVWTCLPRHNLSI